MKKKKLLAWATLAAASAAGAGVAASYLVLHSNPVFVAAMLLNYGLSFVNPPGTMTIESRKPAAVLAQPGVPGVASDKATKDATNWAGYNRTVTSDRFSPLSQISTQNAQKLKILCTYDTNRFEGFQTGLLMVEGALIGTTAEDLFSIDPDSCEENWRISEKSGLHPVPTNRGAAYLDGKLFRAFADGYMRAYDIKTGKRVWETFIGDKNNRLWFTSAPIAWNGIVFFGTAGGDVRNIRGRVYGLDAQTGKILWQTFTVPKLEQDQQLAPLGKVPVEMIEATWGNAPDVPVTGGGTWTSYTIDPETGYLYVPVGNPAPDFVKSLRPGSNLFTNTVLVLDSATGDYVTHHSVMPDDWHDWDVSNPPILYTTSNGRKQLSFHPKDGYLYSFDRTSGEMVFRKPVTRMYNGDTPFETGKPVYFCPGSVGGGEWSSAAYHPQLNLIYTGQVDWCTVATVESETKVRRYNDGEVWFGESSINPRYMAGNHDHHLKWGGWFYASDADTGEWTWRARTNYPIVGAVTPTAGGIVAFGDIGGNFYVLAAADGRKLWSHSFKGAIGGGVITYQSKDAQRIALTSGMTHPLWPVWPQSGKVVVLGLE